MLDGLIGVEFFNHCKFCDKPRPVVWTAAVYTERYLQAPYFNVQHPYSFLLVYPFGIDYHKVLLSNNTDMSSSSMPPYGGYQADFTPNSSGQDFSSLQDVLPLFCTLSAKLQLS